MKHKEAFCLMQYQCKRCLAVEIVWNSRDGVTPFIIPCRLCGCLEMTHMNWHLDVCDPYHCPKHGDRVFIDRTADLARIYTRMAVEQIWEHPEYPMKDQFVSKAAAVDQMSKVKEGEPFLFTVMRCG